MSDAAEPTRDPAPTSAPASSLWSRLREPGPALLTGGAAALLATVGWLGLRAPERAGGQQRPPYVLPVRLAEVVRRQVSPRIQLTGTARAVRRAELSFTVSGLLASTDAREGDAVREGQVLASLDAGDQDLVLQARRAELSLAERTLAKLVAGPRPEERARLRAELEVAEAEERLAAVELERARSLLSERVVSQADLDRQRANLDAARGRAGAARARVSEADAGSRAEDIEVARAEMARAQAAVATAEREQAKTRLRAPWAGIVSQRRVSSGKVVAAGQAIYELVDPDELEVEVEVPARYAPRLGARPRARLSVDELPAFSLEAELDVLIPVADPLSRNFTGMVRLVRPREPSPGAGDPLSDLRPGMFVRLELELAPLEEPLVVPSDAVRVTARGPVLVRAAQGQPGPDGQPGLVAQWVPVSVLGVDAQGTAVESLGPPLTAGDQVVTTGVDLAFPGAPLLPRPQPAPGEPGDPPPAGATKE